MLERSYHPRDAYPDRSIILEFDASTWGYGGVLYRDGVPSSWYAEAVSKEDVERFRIEIGSPKCQALLETLAILIGLRAWADLISGKRWSVLVRSDSRAALGAAFKLRSPVPALNAVVRELALDLAESRYDLDFIEHLPGRCNVFADTLSRFYQPGQARTVPPELAAAPRAFPARRIGAWWETAGTPEDEEAEEVARAAADLMAADSNAA